MWEHVRYARETIIVRGINVAYIYIDIIYIGCDVFDHIEKETERVFLVRVSFIEIYTTKRCEILAMPHLRFAKIKIVVSSSTRTRQVLFAGERNRSFGGLAISVKMQHISTSRQARENTGPSQ